jgi:hypothetical protein
MKFWGKSLRAICEGENIRNYIQYFIHLMLFCLCAFLLTVFVLCLLLSSYVYLLYCIAILLYMTDFCLEVSICEVLRPTTSTQVFVGFPVYISDC